MMIFGYGSLLAAELINHRNFKRVYSESDLTVCNLYGYKRGWNALCGDYRYLGIVESVESRVNGVIFPLDDCDVDVFKKSEGFDLVDCAYDFVDVTDKIDVKVESERIYTCVTKKPVKTGIVPNYYLLVIIKCLEIRGWDFGVEFLNLTEEDRSWSTGPAML